MMRRYIAAVIILFAWLAGSQGQSKVKVDKNDFRTESVGFEEAWRHYKNAEALYKDGGFFFNLSLTEYEQAYLYNPNSAELNYKIGVASLFSDRKDEAAGYFVKAIELNPEIAPDLYFLAGRAFQYGGKYFEAAGKYTEFMNKAGKREQDLVLLAERYLQECNVAVELTASPLPVTIGNFGEKVNSEADDFSPVLMKNGKGLYYASRIPMKRSSTFYPDNMPDENIFVTTFAEWGEFSTPYAPEGDVNTEYCEVPLWFDSKEELLYIYAGYVAGGDILVSEFKKGKWRAPADPGLGINSKDAETSLCFDPSGKWLYFVSDRSKKSIGGNDIWMAERRSRKKWKKPVNIGQLVNSQWNEESVSLSRGGDTLFFASDRKGTMGGYDIFASVKQDDGSWGAPVNMGYPLNTSYNEMFLVQRIDSDSIYYFSSDRRGGFGRMDLYMARLTAPVREVVIEVVETKPAPVIAYDTVVVIKEVPPPVIEEKPVEFILAGRIVDSETNSPIYCRIDVIDLSADRVVATTVTDTTGAGFRVRVPGKKSYLLDMRAPGYLSAMERVDIPESFEGEVFYSNLSLIKVKVGRKVVLKNILFEVNRAVLTVESFSELNRLVSILKENPTMRIEIAGHTDNTGSYATNIRLSKERAGAVVRYLIDNGIEQERLQFTGYGPDQPVTGNDTAEGRALNRRVEFKILQL